MMRACMGSWAYTSEPTYHYIEKLSKRIVQGGLEPHPEDRCKLRFSRSTIIEDINMIRYTPEADYVFDSALEATMALEYMRQLLKKRGVK